MRGVVLQTQADAPAGRLDAWAMRHGLALEAVRVDLETTLPDPREYEFAVALGSTATAAGGGPAWVAREIDWLREADRVALPVLGICFGAQALAVALGGRVRRMPKPEVGWVSVESADADRVPSGPWMAWHEDGIDLPPLAYELARNAFGVQAYCHCRHFAVQFHPEVDRRIAAAWSSLDHGDLARSGTTREALEADTARYIEPAAAAAERLFDGFAARAGLGLTVA